MAPLLAEKLVPLKLAIPLVPIPASSMVIVLPAALALANDNAPFRPFNDVTPLLLGQAANVGAPAVDTKQSPGLPATTDVNGAVPAATTTPFAASDVVPVPPLLTVSALPSDSPPVTTFKSPVIVTVVPLWVTSESSIFCDPVNIARAPVDPPPLVTVPVPAPTLFTVKLPLPSLVTVVFVPAKTFSTPVFCNVLPTKFNPPPTVIAPVRPPKLETPAACVAVSWLPTTLKPPPSVS